MCPVNEFVEKQCYGPFLDFRRKNYDFSSKKFQQGCENCIPPVQRNKLTEIFMKNSSTWGESFWLLSNVTVTFSELHSTCSDKHFIEFCLKKVCPIYFWTSREVSGFSEQVFGGVVKKALQVSGKSIRRKKHVSRKSNILIIFRLSGKNLSAFCRKTKQWVCQNCNLRVQTTISTKIGVLKMYKSANSSFCDQHFRNVWFETFGKVALVVFYLSRGLFFWREVVLPTLLDSRRTIFELLLETFLTRVWVWRLLSIGPEEPSKEVRRKSSRTFWDFFEDLSQKDFFRLVKTAFWKSGGSIRWKIVL